MKIICHYCGNEGERYIGHVNYAKKHGKNIYCNRKCADLGQRLYFKPLSQELVKELFDYRDGSLYWKSNSINKRGVPVAGSLNIGHGYWEITINNKAYRMHRIIFLFHYGYMPAIVDHEDRNKTNNRIENLRAATHSQNQANRTAVPGRTSKYLGVSKTKKVLKKQWRASLKTKGMNYETPYFLTENEAALAYNRLAVMHHKEFANLNILKP